MNFDDYKITDLHIYLEGENYKVSFTASYFNKGRIVFQKKFTNFTDGSSFFMDLGDGKNTIRILLGYLDSLIENR